MAEIIDGRKLAEEIYQDLRLEMSSRLQCGTVPGLALVHVGEHPESEIYLRQKKKIAENLGIGVHLAHLPSSSTKEEIIDAIDCLNADAAIHGILVQSPLPDRSQENEVFNHVAAEKDVDGFSAVNLGKLCQGDSSGFWPCTPSGVHHMIQSTGMQTEGKRVVVLGRSLIVGKPMGLILMQNQPSANATVTFCHSKTRDMVDIMRQADILIAAMGSPDFVKASMVKRGACVIDVGISRVPDSSKRSGYRLQGDVDFEAVSQVADFITPVPGGVGPMTVAMLMANTLWAYRQQVDGE